MPKIDVTDEAVIDSQPMDVYKAILNELSGYTHWWLPHIEFKPEGSIDREGAIFDATINPKSRLSVKCSAKITKLVAAKAIELEYFSGDFVGTGTYEFEPKDEKTILRYRFNVKPKKPLMSFLAHFINVGKAHSKVMQQGFKACNSHLTKKKQWG